MSFLTAVPEMMSAAVTDLAGIGSTLSEASSAASAATTGVMPPAMDEVSEAISCMFGAHGQAYQALSARAAQFHAQFVEALTAGANAYAGAEASVVQTMQSGVASPVQAVSAATASPLQQLEQAQIGFNANLVNAELTFNHQLLTGEVALEQSIFGTDSALNGVINRSFNVGNPLWGTAQQTVNTLVGAPVPTNFTSGLLQGSADQVFNSGQIGGPLGAFDQSLVVGADFAGLVLTSPPGQALLSVLPAQTQAMLASAPANFLAHLETAQLAYNTGLISHELSFNDALVTHEIGLEQNIFGTDSALNGTLNRSFNAVNLLIGTGEQGLNNLSGALVSQPTFNQSLLTGTGAQTFNSGEIGGLTGVVDQTIFAGVDLLGLLAGQ